LKYKEARKGRTHGLFFMLIFGKENKLSFIKTKFFEFMSHNKYADKHIVRNQPSRGRAHM
jgi:hypothetical protein